MERQEQIGFTKTIICLRKLQLFDINQIVFNKFILLDTLHRPWKMISARKFNSKLSEYYLRTYTIIHSIYYINMLVTVQHATRRPTLYRKCKRLKDNSQNVDDHKPSGSAIFHFGQKLNEKLVHRCSIITNTEFTHTFDLAPEPNWLQLQSVDNNCKLYTSNTFEFDLNTGLQASIVKFILSKQYLMYHVTCYLHQWDEFREILRSGKEYIHITKYWCLCDGNVRIGGLTDYQYILHRHMIITIPKENECNFKELINRCFHGRSSFRNNVNDSSIVCAQIPNILTLSELLYSLFTPLKNCPYKYRSIVRRNILFPSNDEEDDYVECMKRCVNGHRFNDFDIFYSNIPIMPNVIRFLLFFDSDSIYKYAATFSNDIRKVNLETSFSTKNHFWYSKLTNFLHGHDECCDMLLPIPYNYQICDTILISTKADDGTTSNCYFNFSDKYLFCGRIIIFFNTTRQITLNTTSCNLNFSMYYENSTLQYILELIYIKWGHYPKLCLDKLLNLVQNPQLCSQLSKL